MNEDQDDLLNNASNTTTLKYSYQPYNSTSSYTSINTTINELEEKIMLTNKMVLKFFKKSNEKLNLLDKEYYTYYELPFYFDTDDIPFKKENIRIYHKGIDEIPDPLIMEYIWDDSKYIKGWDTLEEAKLYIECLED